MKDSIEQTLEENDFEFIGDLAINHQDVDQDINKFTIFNQESPTDTHSYTTRRRLKTPTLSSRIMKHKKLNNLAMSEDLEVKGTLHLIF